MKSVFITTVMLTCILYWIVGDVMVVSGMFENILYGYLLDRIVYYTGLVFVFAMSLTGILLALEHGFRYLLRSITDDK